MTHKQKVLRLLSDRKPHSHHELYRLGCVAHSRISDLRRDGHVIEAWKDRDLYLYRLVSSPGALDDAAAESPLTTADPLTPLGALPVAASSSVSSIPPRRLSRGDHHADAPARRWGGDTLTLFDTEEAA